jgi:hypothetical protein
MARRLGDQTVTVRRAPTIADSHNDTARRDWAHAVSHDVENCYFELGASEEVLVGRDAVKIAATVFAPAGTDVLATDRIVYEGIEYAVDGQPMVRRSFSRRLDHLEVVLKEWTG